MPPTTAEEAYEQVRALPRPEQERLIEHIVRGLEDSPDEVAANETSTKRRWSELRGALPYPSCGEDAQAWVSRTRRESDEARERLLRGEP